MCANSSKQLGFLGVFMWLFIGIDVVPSNLFILDCRKLFSFLIFSPVFLCLSWSLLCHYDNHWWFIISNVMLHICEYVFLLYIHKMIVGPTKRHLFPLLLQSVSQQMSISYVHSHGCYNHKKNYQTYKKRMMI